VILRVCRNGGDVEVAEGDAGCVPAFCQNGAPGIDVHTASPCVLRTRSVWLGWVPVWAGETSTRRRRLRRARSKCSQGRASHDL